MRPRSVLYYAVCFAAFLGGSGLSAQPAEASHTTITTNQVSYSASPFNGYRVYLSSPTHTNSGSRGELGWEENINGRHWNVYAANSAYLNESVSSNAYRNLRVRGYHVVVSENSRNGWFMDHVDDANAWGADVYITTHTNCCGGSYFLTMVDKQTHDWRDDKLRGEMIIRLGHAVPGSDVASTDASDYVYNRRNLGELGSTNNAPYNVYNEVIFHDNQNHVNWLGSGSDWIQVTNNTWRYGFAVDKTLGYPRG